jgi:predicted nucleotidyltransferase component of viral defense system
MIEQRLVQWYAADGGVDLDIAEREIVLAYALYILSNGGLLRQLAFKGGTAIRKLYLGGTGRFSLDLDFTATVEVAPDDLILDLVGLLHEQTYFGLTFSIASSDYYATADSCGAGVTYQHDWVTGGRFDIQISFRAQPLLTVYKVPLQRERYFEWVEFQPPEIPALDLHEVIGEKIRAAAQRTRVRDLYDLYQLARQPYDRHRVRRIAVVKCWETRYAFDALAFLSGLPDGKYDWHDLGRLVRRDRLVAPDVIVRDAQQAYAFLTDMTFEEAQLASDPYGRETDIYHQLVNSLQGIS